MAVLTRRTWSDLLAEHKLRVGRNTSGYDSRGQRFLETAQYDLGTVFYHPDLTDPDGSITLSTSNPYVNLPNDWFVILVIQLLDEGGTSSRRRITMKHPSVILQDPQFGRTGEPTKAALLANQVWFDRLPEHAWKARVVYQKLPTAPDFAGSVSPDLHRSWDDRILERAAILHYDAHGRPDLGDAVEKRFQGWLKKNPTPTLQSMTGFEAHDFDALREKARPTGGRG